ncbi:MAG: hypothetical protein KGL66_11845 [Alphaproteobacteria bacterium]|nr:hypothetical protein [Alphaproteobacteria bacterium]
MKSTGIGALVLLASAACVGTAAAADAPVLGKGSYGQYLIDRAAAAHHDIAAIAIYAAPAAGKAAVAVAARNGEAGAPAPEKAATVAEAGKSQFLMDKAAHRFDAMLPLPDMSHKPAGVLSLSLNAPGGDEAALKAEAIAIRDSLSRRISYTANLLQPESYDPNVPVHSYAQHLVDAALKRHPDVIILAIHAATPKNSDPEILASNIGRIGKRADDDDMRVVRDGKTNLEVNRGLMRYEVELPLNDVSGARVGALGVVFALDAHTDRQARHAEAIRIRDEISRRILTPANLVEAWPYDPNYSDKTYAQALVDRTLAADRDVLVLALHVTPPGSKKNIILASNIGRIGKVADSDDMGVVTSGVPAVAVNAEGNRFEAELALKDRRGTQIGAVSVVFAYKPGADKAAFRNRAQAIADSLAREIPDAAALFKPRG